MMVLAHIDSDSIWVENMKNRTEVEMMLDRRQALKRMHAVGIIPKRQVLENKTSMAYRQEIMETGMTYQLVPPDDHRRNIAEKNPNMERPLHFSLQWCLRTLPNAPMVQAHPKSQKTVVTTQAKIYQPKHFGFRLPLWPA